MHHGPLLQDISVFPKTRGVCFHHHSIFNFSKLTVDTVLCLICVHIPILSDDPVAVYGMSCLPQGGLQPISYCSQLCAYLASFNLDRFDTLFIFYDVES